MAVIQWGAVDFRRHTSGELVRSEADSGVSIPCGEWQGFTAENAEGAEEKGEELTTEGDEGGRGKEREPEQFEMI